MLILEIFKISEMNMSIKFELDVTEGLLEAIKSAYQVFETNGYISDENTSLSSTFYEHKTELLYKEFCKLGYEGKKFTCHGHFYQNYGAVYWVYDSRVMSYKRSRELINQLVESKKL